MAIFKRFSLTNRLLTTSTLALLIALSAIGLVMDRAFRDKTLNLVEERLDTYVLALLSALDADESGLLFPQSLPTPKMKQPGSGMYAEIISAGERWQSPSLLGQSLRAMPQLAAGQKSFQAGIDKGQSGLFSMSQGFEWDTDGEVIPLTIRVTEDAQNFIRELAEFEENLWMWLLFTSVVLLGVQWLIMNWASQPLQRLTEDLLTLEKGHREKLPNDYPTELLGLTENVNRLIENERKNLQRQRLTLGDLAHSLKTPLAIIKGALDAEPVDRGLINQQIMNMDEIVAYQLQRAAVAGHRTFSVGIPVVDDLNKIIGTLEKVHRDKSIHSEVRVPPGAEFYGERGDLMELLGNLLENAFKWCDSRVEVTIRILYMEGRKRTGLTIDVADDGPGIPSDRREELLKRGVRGDEKVKGHGIGLSIVNDIVDSYRGQIEISRHKTLGGAHFRITLPP